MTASTDQLQVASVTGIDLSLRIAGLGGRSYAFVVDWHIRVVGALAWYALAGLVLYGDLLPTPTGGWLFFFTLIMPGLAIYLLYHPVLEVVMSGRTPGKRIAGLRIVTVDGQVPSIGPLLIRNVLRLLDSMPGLYAVGLAAVLATRQSVRIGDLAAGTLLVYEDADSPLTGFDDGAAQRLGFERAELTRELLRRWRDLEPPARRLLAGRLLDEDAAGDSDAELRKRLEELVR